MIRLVVGLLGLAVIGAVFVGIYYSAPEGTRRPPYSLAPGEVESDQLQPARRAGHRIELGVEVVGGPIDVYIMDADQARLLVADGLNLHQPFSYHASLSRLNVTGSANVTIVSDGATPLTVILDNSDNHYNDTAPSGVASVRLVTRYPAEEQRNLLLAYLAAIPSGLLVLVTILRKARRWRRRQG